MAEMRGRERMREKEWEREIKGRESVMTGL